MPIAYFSTNERATYDFHEALPQRTWEFTLQAMRHHPERRAETLAWDVNRVGEDMWWEMLALGTYRYAVGPPVGRGGDDFVAQADLYSKTHSYVRDGAIVRWGGDLRTLKQIPPRFDIMVDPQGQWFGWDLKGRTVWVGEGDDLLEQWRRYCELRLCGVAVRGVLIGDVAKMIATQGTVIGGNLRVANGMDALLAARYGASIGVIDRWWKAVGKRFD